MDIPSHYTTKTAQETGNIGEALALKLLGGEGERPGSRVLCLSGDLGSGKTTFTQGFARGLGIHHRLLSPTFIIVRRYSVPGHSFLYHLDLYRLKTTDDLRAIGIEEFFADTGSFVVIEWADRLGTLLPAQRTDVHFDVPGDSGHRIRVTHHE